MLALYFFGQVVEQVLVGYFQGLGYILYGSIYLVAIILSDLPITIEKQNSREYTSLGASGGTAALMLASVVLNPMSSICLYFFICLPAILFALLFQIVLL
jgi:membrane associated rhomboid family serine protease